MSEIHLPKIEPATVRDIYIGLEDGFLLFHVHLVYDSFDTQIFGPIALSYKTQKNQYEQKDGGLIIHRVLQALEVESLDKLKKYRVRALIKADSILALGHLTKNQWAHLPKKD